MNWLKLKLKIDDTAPTDQRPQECVHCVNNHCQHPYYNDCDCASWIWCDLFTPKPRKMENNQTPSECKHYGKRNFFEWLMDSFPHCKCPNKESGICIWKNDSRANCPDYEPKKKKDE